MFNYLDALDFDDQLTEEERTLRDQARTFCTERLMPRVTQAFRDESGLPRPIMLSNPSLSYDFAFSQNLTRR